MQKLFLIIIICLITNEVKVNEPFVVLEYNGAIGSEKTLNRENVFIKNQNYSVNHQVKNGESLSRILKKYYGNSGLNMKIIEISVIEMNKHAFVRNNPHFLYAGKKIKIPSINEIMNLVKNVKNPANSINSSRSGHIYFYGN